MNIPAKYEGKYVILDDAGEVVLANRNPAKAVDRARKRGTEDPMIVFVPRSENAYIY
jgi:hypothetical protein